MDGVGEEGVRMERAMDWLGEERGGREWVGWLVGWLVGELLD